MTGFLPSTTPHAPEQGKSASVIVQSTIVQDEYERQGRLRGCNDAEFTSTGFIILERPSGVHPASPMRPFSVLATTLTLSASLTVLPHGNIY